MSIKSKLIRLAYDNKEARPQILAMLKQGWDDYSPDDGTVTRKENKADLSELHLPHPRGWSAWVSYEATRDRRTGDLYGTDIQYLTYSRGVTDRSNKALGTLKISFTDVDIARGGWPMGVHIYFIPVVGDKKMRELLDTTVNVRKETVENKISKILQEWDRNVREYRTNGDWSVFKL